eukprot:480541-Rhodomonas_salina.2
MPTEYLRSAFDSVAGMGKALQGRVLHKFGSVRGVVAAGVQGLLSVEGVTPELAQEVWARLRKEFHAGEDDGADVDDAESGSEEEDPEEERGRDEKDGPRKGTAAKPVSGLRRLSSKVQAAPVPLASKSTTRARAHPRRSW